MYEPVNYLKGYDSFYPLRVYETYNIIHREYKESKIEKENKRDRKI